MTTQLRVEDLSKWHEGSTDRLLALDTLSFDVLEGEFLCIVGPSGCGKSTLLRIIAGLEKPSSGSVLLNGNSLKGPDPRISMVFQTSALYPWRTVIGNVSFGLEVQGVPEPERRRRATALLASVGLQGYENYYPNHLSGGMKQKVGIARALVVEPEVILMDEPFSSLDEFTAEMLREEVQEIHQESHRTIVQVTHNLSEAIQLADRIIILTSQPGRVKNTLEIALTHPRDPLDHEFVRVHREIYALLREELETSIVRHRLRRIRELSQIEDIETR